MIRGLIYLEKHQVWTMPGCENIRAMWTIPDTNVLTLLALNPGSLQRLVICTSTVVSSIILIFVWLLVMMMLLRTMTSLFAFIRVSILIGRVLGNIAIATVVIAVFIICLPTIIRGASIIGNVSAVGIALVRLIAILI